MLLGRVGDTPFIGCGFYAGTACAVTATGMGEQIIQKMLSREVYDSVAGGVPIKEACTGEIDRYAPGVPTGIIGISRSDCAVVSNTGMAAYSIVKDAGVE